MSEAIGKIAEDVLARIRTIPDEEFRRREQECKNRVHEQAVSVLISRCKAPLRHVSERGSINRAGEWGEKLEKASGMVGSGFLLALVGTRGSGKTQIAVEVMFHAMEKERSARYLTAMEFFLEIKRTYAKDAKESEEDILRSLAKPKLLVIDEIAKRGETDWENRLLFELIDRRYREMLDTLVIANQSKPEFIASIGPSLADRMNESGGIIECNWKSFRV